MTNIKNNYEITLTSINFFIFCSFNLVILLDYSVVFQLHDYVAANGRMRINTIHTNLMSMNLFIY